MALQYGLQTNFTAGEVSPRLWARSDLSIRNNAAKTLENFLPLPQGSITRRPGLHHVAEVKDSTRSTRLIPFQFSVEQAYICEFGNQYIRFFTLSGQLVDGGGSPVEIVSPYLEADLFDLWFEQEADTMWITHPSYDPRTLTRTAATTFTLTKIPFIGGPWLDENEDQDHRIQFGTVEQITNGTFDSDISGWTDSSTGAGSIAHDAVDERMQITGGAGGGDVGIADQNVTGLTDGKTYFLFFQVFDDDIELSLGTSQGFNDILTKATFAIGTHSVQFTMSGTSLWIRFEETSTATSEIDNVQLPEGITNLVVNGDASEGNPGANGWTEYGLNGAKGVISTEDEGITTFVFQVGSADSATGIYQELSTVQGRVYVIGFAVKAGPITFQAGTVVGSDNVVESASFDAGFYTVIFTAKSTSTFIDFATYGITGVSITNVTVFDVSGETLTLTATKDTWTSDHVGAFWRLFHKGRWWYVQIDAFNSATNVDVSLPSDPLNAIVSDTPTIRWQEGAWSDERGFPSVITLYQQRAVYAGSTHEPQTIWGSRTGSLDDFTPGVTDDASFKFVLDAAQVNIIRWLSDQQDLMIGTVGGEHRMSGGNLNPITPTNVFVRPQSVHGSNTARPIKVGGQTVFVQRSGRKPRALTFNFNEDVFKSSDLSLLVEHFFRNTTISEMSYEREPDSVIWIRTANGTLHSMTWLQDQAVISWATHPLTGTIESLATIPHPDGDKDQTWAIVNRTIDGVTKRYVEWLDRDIELDSALVQDFGVAVTTITGLGHLEGETVQVIGDGTFVGEETVSSAQIEIDHASQVVQIGKGYTPKLVTLRIARDLSNGPAFGRIRRWIRMTALVENTTTLYINGNRVPFRVPSDPMDSHPSAPETADLSHMIVGFQAKGEVTIEQQRPYPVTINSLFGTIELEDA